MRPSVNLKNNNSNMLKLNKIYRQFISLKGIRFIINNDKKFDRGYSVNSINSINNDYINYNTNVIKHTLNNDVKFNAGLANSRSVAFSFKEVNRLDIISKQHLASEMLTYAFLKLGCLISKPTFKLVNDYKAISYEKAIKDKVIEVYSEKSIMDIENSQNFMLRNKQRWIIRLFFYVREPYRCFNSKYSRLLRDKINNLDTNISNNNSSELIKKNRRRKVEFNFVEIYNTNLSYLVRELSRLLDTNIELELVQLKRPYHNSDILSHYLNLSSFNYKFVQLINDLLKKIRFLRNYRNLRDNNKLNLLSIISGVKIRLGGRTYRQKIIPRKTVQQIQRGSLARDKVSFVEKSISTGKTRRGAYSFSVKLGHIIK